jgi:hypothetical protein
MEKPVYRMGNIRNHIEYSNEDWSSLQELWGSLPLDNYMRDEGKYRRRRYSCVLHDQVDKKTDLIGDSSFYQSKEINPLNGGVVRRFEPVPMNLLANVIVTRLLDYFASATGRNECQINVHQHRIVARGAAHGKPTPEGIHRDGVGHIVMMLVAKVNVQGGTSTLYDNCKQPVAAYTLTEPGDYIFLADQTCLHSASRVRAIPPFDFGYRDMLFLEFV